MKNTIYDMVLAKANKSSNPSTDKEDYPIIDFITKEYGLNQKVFPAQRMILKMMNHEALDDTIRDIEVRDDEANKVAFTFTEKGYHEYLVADGRITYDVDYMKMRPSEVQLIMGRRASKSTMISFFVAYRLWILLKNDSPQEYYGIISTDPISISIVALGERSAKKLLVKIYSMIMRCKQLRPHLRKEYGQFTIPIWSRRDLAELSSITNTNSKDKGFSIEIGCYPNSPSVRGDNNIICIFEEFAHFNISSSSTRDEPLDKMIYDAMTPSIAAFNNPKTGNPEGVSLIISSPNFEMGEFYDNHMNAVEHFNNSGTLAIECPSWEINPTLSYSFLKKKRDRNVDSFNVEYGSKYKKKGKSWITELDHYYRSFDYLNDGQVKIGNPNNIYYLGIDFALTSDGASMAICSRSLFEETESNLHPKALTYMRDVVAGDLTTPLTHSMKYVVDFVDIQTPQTGSPLQLDDLIINIAQVYFKYKITFSVYDQWSGEVIKQVIEKAELPNIEMMVVTQQLNSQIAKNFKSLLLQDEIKMPWDTTLHHQLLGLKAKYNTNGTIKVEAASADVHDDAFDAVARAVYLTYLSQEPKYLREVHKGKLGGIEIDKFFRKHKRNRQRSGSGGCRDPRTRELLNKARGISNPRQPR